MKEADDLIAAMQRLIKSEDDVADGYFGDGMSLSEGQHLPFGTCMYAAGRTHDLTASYLRAELAALEAKYGRRA